ncbi:MAG: TetR/AcrR family transcriptional regulator [Lachnospiraceae bacterium]|nr:TetR/AcrR family transcriptional regulator [Lachnospiraceae bacterium]
MNTKNNQRFHETGQKLIHAFIELSEKKPIEKITVTDLCRKSGINRSSFYLHYKDIFDMADRMEEVLILYYNHLFTRPLENTKSNEDYELSGRFALLFRFIKEHQSYYRFYLSRNRTLHLLEAALPTNAKESLQEWAEKMGIHTERELHYHQAFFQSGLSAMVKEWLEQGCIESPEEMSEILKKEYQKLESM